MRRTHDPRFNIAYIRFRRKSTEVQSVKISEELIVDMTPAPGQHRRIQNTVVNAVTGETAH